MHVGCAFGETSKMYGYPKTWIQVPSPHLDCPINSCNEVCLCNQKAEMRQCHTMPFQQFESCSIKNQIYGTPVTCLIMFHDQRITIIKQNTGRDSNWTATLAFVTLEKPCAPNIIVITRVKPASSDGAVHCSRNSSVALPADATSTVVMANSDSSQMKCSNLVLGLGQWALKWKTMSSSLTATPSSNCFTVSNRFVYFPTNLNNS